MANHPNRSRRVIYLCSVTKPGLVDSMHAATLRFSAKSVSDALHQMAYVSGRPLAECIAEPEGDKLVQAHERDVAKIENAYKGWGFI